MLIIVFDIKDIVHKEFGLAGQNSQFRILLWRFPGDCVKMREDFAPNFGDKITGRSITTTHRLTFSFLPGNFLPKNNRTVVPHPPYLSLFPQLKIKLKAAILTH
jgi:hypothetical protein